MDKQETRISRTSSVRAREAGLLDRLGRMPLASGLPDLTDAQVERVADAFAAGSIMVYRAVVDRADRYGPGPMADVAAILDFELLRWRRKVRSFVPARTDRSQAWAELAVILGAKT
jgi:hypothetical protein